jgi:tripartite-type tricarboxylate transporter receptor subunit TctC
MTLLRIGLLGAVSLIAVVSGAMPDASAQAAPYPTQTVKIVDPFSAGSISDILARVVADKLSEMWHQPVIVENKPGVAGTVSVGKSPADGYTLMVTSNGHTIIGALNKNVGVDPVKDFAGVSEIASVPLVLIVTPSLPAANLQELIALAKAKPGTLNFTSAGLASSSYIASEVFKQTAKIDIVHVPYKGTPEQLTSLMRGDAQLSLAFLGTAVSFIQTGKVRALAMATPKRMASLPNIPTFAESGLPAFHYDSWFGMLAPANTPAPLLKKISADVATVLKMPDVQARWETLGAIPVSNTPEEFDAIIRSDTQRYGKVLRDAGVTPQ